LASIPLPYGLQPARTWEYKTALDPGNDAELKLPDHGAHKKPNEARIAISGIEYVRFFNGYDKLQEVDMRHTVEP
jgi:hypothetical protein